MMYVFDTYRGINIHLLFNLDVLTSEAQTKVTTTDALILAENATAMAEQGTYISNIFHLT